MQTSQLQSTPAHAETASSRAVRGQQEQGSSGSALEEGGEEGARRLRHGHLGGRSAPAREDARYAAGEGKGGRGGGRLRGETAAAAREVEAREARGGQVEAAGGRFARR